MRIKMAQTPVLFRIDTRPKAYDGPDDEPIAVFPTIPGSPGMMTCYARVGQHGSAAYAWLADRTHRPATPKEYAPLLRELRRVGYRALKIYRRMSARQVAMRRAAESA